MPRGPRKRRTYNPTPEEREADQKEQADRKKRDKRRKQRRQYAQKQAEAFLAEYEALCLKYGCVIDSHSGHWITKVTNRSWKKTSVHAQVKDHTDSLAQSLHRPGKSAPLWEDDSHSTQAELKEKRQKSA